MLHPPTVTSTPQARRRSVVLFVALCAVGSGVAWRGSVGLAAAVTEPGACRCTDDQDVAEVRARLAVAWGKAFDGERPDDEDLAAYQDAIEVLDCLTASAAADP